MHVFRRERGQTSELLYTLVPGNVKMQPLFNFFEMAKAAFYRTAEKHFNSLIGTIGDLDASLKAQFKWNPFDPYGGLRK